MLVSIPGLIINFLGDGLWHSAFHIQPVKLLVCARYPARFCLHGSWKLQELWILEDPLVWKCCFKRRKTVRNPRRFEHVIRTKDLRPTQESLYHFVVKSCELDKPPKTKKSEQKCVHGQNKYFGPAFWFWAGSGGRVGQGSGRIQRKTCGQRYVDDVFLSMQKEKNKFVLNSIRGLVLKVLGSFGGRRIYYIRTVRAANCLNVRIYTICQIHPNTEGCYVGNDGAKWFLFGWVVLLVSSPTTCLCRL